MDGGNKVTVFAPDGVACPRSSILDSILPVGVVIELRGESDLQTSNRVIDDLLDVVLQSEESYGSELGKSLGSLAAQIQPGIRRVSSSIP